MRFARRFVLTFSSFLLAFPTLGQQTSTTVQRDPQAVNILRRSFLAMGGANASSISTVIMLGEATRQLATAQATGSVALKWAGPSVCRLDLAFSSFSIFYVVNGRAAIRIENGVSQQLPLHATVNHPLKYLPVLAEASAWNDPGYAVSYIGLETLNGTQVHHIHVEEFSPGTSGRTAALLSKISGIELFIDANSFMLVKRSQELASDADMGTTVLLEQYFSSYQLNNGISIPHQISEYLRGQKHTDIQVTSVQVNQAISASDFEVQP